MIWDDNTLKMFLKGEIEAVCEDLMCINHFLTKIKIHIEKWEDGFEIKKIRRYLDLSFSSTVYYVKEEEIHTWNGLEKELRLHTRMRKSSDNQKKIILFTDWGLSKDFLPSNIKEKYKNIRIVDYINSKMQKFMDIKLYEPFKVIVNGDDKYTTKLTEDICLNYSILEDIFSVNAKIEKIPRELNSGEYWFVDIPNKKVKKCLFSGNNEHDINCLNLGLFAETEIDAKFRLAEIIDKLRDEENK